MRNNVTNQPTTADEQADGSATMTTIRPCPDDPPLLPDDDAGAAIPRGRGLRPALPGEAARESTATAWNAACGRTASRSTASSLVADMPAADPARCAAIRVAPDPLLPVVGRERLIGRRLFVSNICSDIDVDGTASRVGRRAGRVLRRPGGSSARHAPRTRRSRLPVSTEAAPDLDIPADSLTRGAAGNR